MKLLFILMCALFLGNLSLANEGGKGGGAGCPQSDGTIITLLECGAYHEPALTPPPPPGPPLIIDKPTEIPDGLNELIKFISNHPYLTDNQKKRILSAVQPTFYRKYFYVDSAPGLTKPIIDRIKGQFQRVTSLDPVQLILYGVTDTNAKLSNTDHASQITYLLPAFRQLKTLEEKMTALIHENYWVLKPDATYLDVVEAEMAFEAAMQRPYDTTRQIEYLYSVFKIDYEVTPEGDISNGNSRYYSSRYEGNRNFYNNHISSPQFMQLLLKRDIEVGALKGLLTDNLEMSNVDLFGSEALQCLSRLSEQERYNNSREFFNVTNSHMTDGYAICATLFLNHRDELLRTYTNSLFLARTKFIQLQLSQYNYDSLLNPLWKMVTVLAGEDINAGGWSVNLREGAQPFLGNLFNWQKVNEKHAKNCLNWTYKGVATEATTIKLTPSPTQHGPFGPIPKDADIVCLDKKGRPYEN